MVDVALGRSPHAKWYEEAESNKKAQYRSKVYGSVRRAVDYLQGEIELPEIVQVRFGSRRLTGRNTYAMASGATIYFGECMFDENGADGDTYAMLGVSGHELSHLSDFMTDNDCLDFGIDNDLVSEGKAEVVGSDVGGENYVHLLCNPPTVEPRDIAEGLVRPAQEPLRKVKNGNGVYSAGKLMVGRVLEADGVSIYDVHARNADYFIDRFIEVSL